MIRVYNLKDSKIPIVHKDAANPVNIPNFAPFIAILNTKHEKSALVVQII
jgi:hypothetical protein